MRNYVFDANPSIEQAEEAARRGDVMVVRITSLEQYKRIRSRLMEWDGWEALVFVVDMDTDRTQEEFEKSFRNMYRSDK